MANFYSDNLFFDNKKIQLTASFCMKPAKSVSTDEIHWMR